MSISDHSPKADGKNDSVENIMIFPVEISRRGSYYIGIRIDTGNDKIV